MLGWDILLVVTGRKLLEILLILVLVGLLKLYFGLLVAGAMLI